MKKTLVISILALSQWSFAYSMPASQFSVRDLQAIFNDAQISVMVGDQAITSVSLVQNGVYRVDAGTCSVEVKIKNAATPNPRFIGNGNYQPVVDSYENQTCQ